MQSRHKSIPTKSKTYSVNCTRILFGESCCWLSNFVWVKIDSCYSYRDSAQRFASYQSFPLLKLYCQDWEIFMSEDWSLFSFSSCYEALEKVTEVNLKINVHYVYNLCFSIRIWIRYLDTTTCFFFSTTKSIFDK